MHAVVVHPRRAALAGGHVVERPRARRDAVLEEPHPAAHQLRAEVDAEPVDLVSVEEGLDHAAAGKDQDVGVVHFATTAEINAALRQEPVHVLHLSGHGRPGLLELEREDGNARQVTADQFVTEAVPPGRMPPVIALAACHTDAAAAGDPSFAARLIARGANVVIGTETAVTDVYATRAFARIYGALADDEAMDVLGAVADARRTVQQELQGSPDEGEQRLGALGEWAVLA